MKVSAGDAYDAVDLVFKSDLVAICPTTGEGEPVRISVSYPSSSSSCPSCLLDGKVEEAKKREEKTTRRDGISHKGSKARNGVIGIGWPEVTVETKSAFKIVCVSPEFNEIVEQIREEEEEEEEEEEREEEEEGIGGGGGPAVWAVVTATFRRTFRWIPEFGGVFSDGGTVFLKVQPVM